MATELVLENFGKLNIKEGTNFPLNFNIQDLTRPESTPSSYSKDVTIIGDKEANKILGQAFDVNISDSSFDINKKVGCNVLQDNATVFDGGYFQLLKVTKTGQSFPNGEPKIEYIGRVKSDLMSFFTDIKDKDLTDLKLGGFDTYEQLNKSNILSSFNNTAADKWKYVPTFKVQNTNIFKSSQWKPAIFAKTFWDEIHAQNGWQYEFDEIPDVRFDRLIIPYTGEFDADENTKNEATVLADDSNFEQYDFLCKSKYNGTSFGSNNKYPELGSGSNKYIDCSNTIQDVFNQYDPAVTYGNIVTPEITAAFTCDYTYTYEIDFDLIWSNFDSNPIELYGSDFDDQLVANYFTESLISDAQVQNNISGPHHSNVGIQVRFDVGDKLQPGNTTVATGKATFTTTVPMNANEVIRLIIFKEEWLNDGTGNDLTWRPEGNQNAERSVCRILNVNSIDLNVVPDLEYNVGTPIYLQDFIPRETKQRDFVKSIIDMYKLTVDIDPDQENKLIYKTRDKYYDDGRKVDWTRKIDKSRPINLEWLVDKQPKKVKFTYKQDEDVFNEAYFNHIKDVYGEFEYDFGNDYNIGTKENEIIFSPTPIQHDVGSDMYLPSLPLSDIEDLNIRLLYDGGLRTAYWFMQNDDGTTPSTNESNYPYFGHLDDPVQPSFDINFGTCEFYYYNSWEFTTDNNLFNLFHRRYISQLTKGRIMTAYFQLSPTDILTLKLNDKIFINDAWWNINKVIDYNANSNSPTKVELVTVDDGVSVPPTRKIGVYNPGPSKPYITTPYIESGTNDTASLNTVSKGFVGAVYGEENTVSSQSSGMIVGDNNTMSGDSMIVGKKSSDGGYNGKIVAGDDLTASDEYDITTNAIDVKDEIKIGGQVITENTISSVGQILYKAKVTQSGTSNPVISEYINNTNERITGIKTGGTDSGGFTLRGFNQQLVGDLEFIVNDSNNVDRGGGVGFYSCRAILIDSSTLGVTQFDETGVPKDGLLDSGNYIIVTITKY